MAGEKLLLPSAVISRLPTQWEFTDEFGWYISPHMWTTLATGTGAAVTWSGIGGGVSLASGTAAAGNDTGVISTNAFVKFLAGAPLYMESMLQYTEASTNKANVFFGCSSVAAAALMTDGAMSTASQSTVGIFKIDGGTMWNAFTSNGTTVTSTLSNTTAGGANWQRLRIECRDLDGVNLECTFFVNDLPLLSNTSPNRPIVHYVALASAAAMKFVPAYVASGSTAAAETLLLDYTAITGHRALTGGF